MKRNRRSRKKNRFYSALVAMLMVVAMAGTTVSTGLAAELSDDSDAGQPTAYATVEDTAGETGEIDSYQSDAGLDDGAQTDPDEPDENGSTGDTGEELSDESVSVLDADAESGEPQEDNEEAAVSDYVFVAEYQGDAYQTGSGDLNAEDFTVSVYDADGNLVDTIPAESVTSDYVVDEDGYILALVVCVYGGETITVETKIAAIQTLADAEAFAVYSADDSSLTFYYGEKPEEGTEYNDKTATNVYTGFDTTAYASYGSVPWYSNRTKFTNVAFDETFASVQPEATAYWFYNFTSCKGMDLTYLETSAVTNMSYMFYSCSGLTSLDVSGFNTANVTNMSYMFYSCSGLTFLDVSGFNTANVTDMSYMFYGCSGLTSLDVSGFDTENATTIRYMFYSCSGLTSLDVSNFNTANVTNMGYMFNACSKLGIIYSDDDNFVTTAVTAGSGMFTNCSNLVGGNGTAVSSSNGTSYTMAHVDTADNPGYFTDESVKYDPVAFAVYSADDTSLTFYFENPIPNVGDDYNGKTVTEVYTGFEKKTYTSGTSSSTAPPWYSYQTSITSVVFDESFSGAQPTAMAFWFYNFKNAEFYGLENIDTSQVTTMADLFRACSVFTNADGLKNWDTGNVTNMAAMFRDCSTLTELDLSNFDTSSCEDMDQMFYLCTNLEKVDVSGFDISNVTAINGMFRDCTALTELDLSSFDTSNVSLINAMFRTDVSLKTIYASEDWDVDSSHIENDANMFEGCTSLVGGNGTVYNSGKVLSSMAKIDRDGTEGYFTNVKVLDTVAVSGTMIWDDMDDQDGIRPESITVNLLANGDPAKDENGNPISMTVTAEDDWSFTFSDLPKYDSSVNEIVYTISEDAVEGYESEITGDMEEGFVITNSHTPEQIEVSGTITWADGNNQDGTRPNFVMVQLIAQDAEGGALGSWEFEIHAPSEPTYDADGNEIWTWTKDGLDQYYGGGQEVNYTVIYTGVDLQVYEQSNTGLDTTYSYTPETTTIFGSKTWVDGDNVENTRPESITVRLHANGDEKVYEQTVYAQDGWAWTFEDVPVYSNGQKIDYTITEDAVDEYDPTYDGWDITNELDRGNTTITVMKDWEDANDQDGKRQESVTVSLWANGVETGETLTLSEENNWEDVFHVPIDEEGTRITYTITEESFGSDYETAITGDVTEGFVITNSYTPETINITGTKEWDDANDQDGMRPSSIYVHLLANGEAVDETEVTADADGNWTFAFPEVSKYASGSEIEYTVEEALSETAADAYTASYSGDIENGFIITNTHTPELLNGDGTLTVTKAWDDDDNRDGIRPDSVTVNLLANGEQIDSATLGSEAEPTGLWQSVKSFFTGTQTLDAEVDGWTATFTDLPKYADGEEILYTVTEDEVESYTADVTGSAADGYTVTNTHKPETISVDVEKIWDDEENQDGKRPDSITINLLADNEQALDIYGNPVTEAITEEDSWACNFGSLYQYRDGGTEIVYTVEEDTTGLPDGYTTETTGDMTTGFTITNSYTPELYNGDGTFKVVVVWDDEANNDGIRPTEVNVKLTKNDTTVEGAEMTLTEVDGWTGTFTDLPKYEDGSEIKYSVKEDVKSGYTYRIELLTDDEGNTYVQLTNVHVSVKEDIEVTKIWDDNDNQDGKRPESITLRLLTNGNLYKERVLTADTEGVTVTENGNVWTYTMSDIPVDKNGEAIEYTMLEVDVENYGTPEIVTIRGDEITDNGVTYQPYSFEVTNSHTPEQIDITGKKVWDDANDQDGKRPHYVELHLFADGVEVAGLDVTAADDTDGDGNWEWAFTGFDKYKDGNEIEYSVTEDEVTGYDTEITGSVEDGFTITNSYEPETTSISGSKTWVDDDNAANRRPSSITVRLHANGAVVDSQTVGESEGWAWEFSDLPVYSNGKHIDYTLTEDTVDDYDTTYTFGDDGSLNVTNTLSPGNTSLTVEKDWEDNDNQDGIRPTEVTVELVRDGAATGQTLTLSDADHWTDTFHDLPEYEGGARIAYTVQEVSVDGYESVIDGDAATGYTITNTHDPEQIDLSGSKVWDDNDDQDGIRPDHVTIHLLADGEALESISVSAADNWEWAFEGLDKYAAGTEIDYTMEEVFVADGYEVDPGNAENDFTFTNTHEPEKIDITGTKTWDDDNDRDGIRPDSITISLLAGDEIVANQTVTEADNWAYTFTDLDKCADGEEINYSISEEVPDDYHASYAHYSYDVTNSHSPELFNGDGTLSVIMHWDDEGDQDGIRPKRTTITLMLNNVPDETITLVLSDDNVDENGNWIGTFSDLYKYADGEEIDYNVEEGVMNGYTYTAELVYDADADLYYIEITNTHAAVTSDITVTKVWDDNDNQDGIRSDSVVVNLFSNGSAVKSVTIKPGKEGVTVSDDGNEWSYTFENMPVDQNGEPIIYSLDEVDVGSYDHVIETTAVGGNEKDGVTYTQYDFTVTNSHTPEMAEVSGEKIWEDADDQDGIRPHSITIELLADGVPALDESGAEITQLVTPHTDGSWTWTFTGIPKYRDGGTEIVYSFEEFSVEGYETSYSADGLTVTNTYEPEITSISGNKVWDDDNDRDGKRPNEITVNLYANGLVKETRTVTAADNWEWEFTDLPVYENGNKITYVTTENSIINYDTTYSGFTLTNTYDPDKTSVTVIADWEDEEDQDGIRPTEITVPLLADGEPALDENGNAITLTLAEDENGIWEGTFEHLFVNSEGTPIEYTLGDVTVEGYECVVEGDASVGFSLTFTHTPETIDEITGSKTWDDADDQDGLRPDSISVHLLANGEEVLTADVTADGVGPLKALGSLFTSGKLLAADGEWAFAFTDLPKYENGQEITYTISETAVTGYGTAITGDAEKGFEIRNTHIPETVSVSGTKVWHDSDNQDGKRPESITVNLLVDGKNSDSLDVTGDGNTWEWAFTDLPKYEAGEAIEYAIDEVAVDEYDTTIAGDAASGYTIINSHTPETLTISGSKTWDDENNQDGLRPSSITIRLHKNGEVVSTRTVTAYDGWSWTFSNEPKYEDGQEITYTITEDSIDEYSATLDGYDVTNSYTPGQTSLMVVKDWEDVNDQDGKRPTSVTVELLADGKPTGQTLTLSEANGWEDTFTELDEYNEGKRIAYTVEEITVDEYDSVITGNETEGYVITNTHELETIDITGTKVWDDEDDRDGKRPESITVNLLNQNGKTVDTQTVTAEDGWTWSFAVDKYAAGQEIDYSGYGMNEVKVKDYNDPEITGSVENGFEITNTHEPETINSDTHVLAVTLRWNDDDNTDGLRPSIVTLTLRANGEDVVDESGNPVTLVLDGSTVDEEGNWVGEFDLTGINLYRYQGGLEISYTVDETDEKDRSLTTDGYTSRTSLVYDEDTGTWSLEVTNSHTTVTQDITVIKKWDDASDQDGKRPDSIHVQLKANGGSIEDGDVTLTKNNVKVSDGGNTWTYVFEEMPVDENGTAIEYTLEEGSVSGYESNVKTDRGAEITESGVTYEPYTFTITNKHEPETIDISGTIEWHDDNNKDGKRPDSVKVYLYDEDDNLIAETTATAENGWTWSFTNLPKYKNGKEIVYTVEAEDLTGDGYTEKVEQGETGETVIYTLTSDQGGGNPTGKDNNPTGKGGNGGSGGNGGTGVKGGTSSNGSKTTAAGNGRTGDTNMLPILLIIIFIAAAAVVVTLVIRMTGSKNRKYLDRH